MAAVEQIYEYTYPAGNNTTQVLIENIPQTYRHLEVVVIGTNSTSGTSNMNVRPNSNSSSIYTFTSQFGNYGYGQTIVQNQTFVGAVGSSPGATFIYTNTGFQSKIMFLDYSGTSGWWKNSYAETGYNDLYAKNATTIKSGTVITSILFTAPTTAMRGGAKIWLNGWNDIDNA